MFDVAHSALFASLVVVFREILEAALVVSIVMAAAKGVPRLGLWVGYGIIGGALGAGLVAMSIGAISDLAAGMGQELFHALVLAIAVCMLGWHCIWMSRHGRELARDIGAVGQAVASGLRPPSALAIVVGIAVLREGSEVVGFLYGIAAEQAGGWSGMLAGGLIGLAAGIAAGMAVYFGLLRIATRYLFLVTTCLIICLAAGMASQAADYLVQAGYLPALGDAIWDSSALLSDGSMLGIALHAMIGYTAQPSGIQLLAYALTLAVIGLLTWRLGYAPRKPMPSVSRGPGAR